MWTTVHTDPRSTLSQSGNTHLRRNEIRDTFATLLDEVCHDVEISLKGESFHNKTTTTEDDARLKIDARKANRWKAKALTTKQPLLKMTFDLT